MGMFVCVQICLFLRVGMCACVFVCFIWPSVKNMLAPRSSSISIQDDSLISFFGALITNSLKYCWENVNTPPLHFSVLAEANHAFCIPR